MTINLNDTVAVRLKPRGREILKRHWQSVAVASGRAVEEVLDGVCKGWRSDDPVDMQLWNVMEYFGPHMHNGCDLPIGTSIDLLCEVAA